jgi:hypothetical protein
MRKGVKKSEIFLKKENLEDFLKSIYFLIKIAYLDKKWTLMSTFVHSCVFLYKFFLKIKSLEYFQKKKSRFSKKENPEDFLHLFSYKTLILSSI